MCAFKDIEGVDKDLGRISERKSLLRLDQLGQDMSVLVINVFVIAGGCVCDLKAMVLVEGKRFLVSGLHMQVHRCDLALSLRCSVFQNVFQQLVT
jgi:hypothetical protein